MPRTLAQTGAPAVGGPVRRLAPMGYSTPIPVRSGQRVARKGGILRRMLALFAIGVVMVLGAAFALTGSAFRVQQMNIVGTQNRVIVDSISDMGIEGQNIFLLNTAAVIDHVQAIPLVASASLEKQLPNSVTVRVVERIPVLLWQTQQGTYSVDSSGKVIAPASETTNAGHLFTVVDMRKGTVHPGVVLNAADIAFATEVFTRLPQMAGINTFTLRYMPASGGNGGESGSYIVESSNDWVAYLGSANDSNPLDNRLLELQQILSMAQQKQLHLATIDLRFGLRPVYTLKS